MRSTSPGQQPEPLGAHAVLLARLVQHLHADADAEHRPPGRDPLGDHRVAADGADACHAGGEGADAGDDQTVGRSGRLEVGGHGHVGAGPRERPLGGAQVARAVVEDDHLRPARVLTARPSCWGSRRCAGRARPRRAAPGPPP